MGEKDDYVSEVVCLKIYLFAFNVVYWFFGLLLLIVALWAEFGVHRYLELAPEFSGTATHLLVGVACLILVVCSFAFSCIVRGQPVQLYLYAAFLACILVMNAGITFSMLCFLDTYVMSLREGLTQTIISDDPHKGNFDFAQKYFRCCGVSNYTDWQRLSPQKVIPISCCIDQYNCVTANYSDVYQRGCLDIIINYTKVNYMVLTAGTLFSALMPIFGTVLTCYLATYSKKCKKAKQAAGIM